MSRSALHREELLKRLPPPPPPLAPILPVPFGYPTPLYYAPNIPTTSVNVHVPVVALTGDEDDFDSHPDAPKKVLPIYGNATTFNLNSLLHSNLLNSDYFRALYQLRTYHEVLGEVESSVTHVEPWQTGTSRVPSTAFCLLLKLMTMSITFKQMVGMIDYEGNAFVRALGFLQLRYTCPPNDLWQWFEKYLEGMHVTYLRMFH